MSSREDEMVSAAKKILYIWIGMVLSLAAAGIWISPGGSLKEIGGDAQVLDLNYWQLSKSNSSIQYDKAADHYEILKDTASISQKINRADKCWNYVSVNIGSMSCPVLEGTLVFYDEEKNNIAEQRMELKQGHSLLALEKVKFSSLKFVTEGHKGDVVSDVTIQFREGAEFFSGKRYLMYVVICFGIYMICILGAYAISRRIKRSGSSEKMSILSVLQDKYCVYVDLIGEKVTGYLSGRWRRIIRTVLMICLIGYLIVINNYGEKYVQDYYDIHMVIILLVFFLFICLCREKKLQAVRWNQRLFFSWGLTAVLMISSDFLITKERMWTGVFILLLFGMFYFVWGNMEYPEQLIQELCIAWTMVFWVGMIYCLLFRKIEAGYIYSGFFTESNTFALFLAIVVEIGIARVLDRKWVALSGIEIGMAVVMIWKTQELFAFSVAIISLAVGLVLIVKKLCRESDWRAGKQYLMALLCIGIAGMFMSQMYIWLRQPLISDVVFAQDVHKEAEAESLFTLVQENHWKYFLYTKFMIWKQYIRGLNLYGHAANAVYNGKKVLPYNGFLLIAYRYGIVTVIPYVVMIAEAFCVCIKKIREKQAGYYVCLFSGMGYVLLNTIQNVEVPYVGLNWLWMALMLGYCFKE
ncbi:MAG: hypothetical protein SOX45_12255 [Lachnospiraceae bacterium]|nr:hypothetical protein [Lachnospiraceae bacterium]